jgi:hypothetical protein
MIGVGTWIRYHISEGEISKSSSVNWSTPYWESDVGVDSEFDPANVTAETIAALTTENPAISALIRGAGWQSALREHSVPSDDPRFVQLQNVLQQIITKRVADLLRNFNELERDRLPKRALQRAQGLQRLFRGFGLPNSHPLLERLDQLLPKLVTRAEPITLEDINSLLSFSDSMNCLVQAQLWREALVNRGAKDNDPRLLRLEEVVQLLRKKTQPMPDPSTERITELRRVVKELAEAIQQDDLAAADRKLADAEELIRKFPEELGPHTRRLFELANRLKERKLLATGVKQIRDLLGESEQHCVTDQITQALEEKARARVLARAAPMSQRDADDLRQQFAQLLSKINFAQGCRAVQDALRCHAVGDETARDEQVREAYRYFAGLPEESIRPWIEQIATWRSNAHQRNRIEQNDNDGSALGFELKMRRYYESALQYYENADIEGLLTVCINANAVGSEVQQQQFRMRVEPQLLELLEQDVNRIVAQPPRYRSSNELRRARSLLDRSKFWQNSPRWRMLDSALREQSKRALETPPAN